MQPVLPQESWEGGTCVAKQPKLFQEILKKLKICVPVQPMLPQKILKKPKTCVPVQPVLRQEILKNPKSLKWVIS